MGRRIHGCLCGAPFAQEVSSSSQVYPHGMRNYVISCDFVSCFFLPRSFCRAFCTALLLGMATNDWSYPPALVAKAYRTLCLSSDNNENMFRAPRWHSDAIRVDMHSG